MPPLSNGVWGTEMTIAPAVIGLRPLKVLRTDPNWNQYLEDPAQQTNFETKFDRIVSYADYGINQGIVNWNIPVWMYFNVHDAADFRLLDTDLTPLYVPWPNDQPPYARQTADIRNASYREAWIEEAISRLDAGYDGFWIDDVNLDSARSTVRGDGSVPQMDMSWWPGEMANFMTEINAALKASYPDCEILHNSVWFANRPSRWTSSVVQEQIQAADYINIEGGFTDPGLNNGIGLNAVSGNDYQQYSLRSMFNYIDQIHSQGKHFIVEQWTDTTPVKTYVMAAWLARGRTGDGIGMATELNNWPNIDPLWTADYGVVQNVNDPGTLGSTITVTTSTKTAVFTPVDTGSASIS